MMTFKISLSIDKKITSLSIIHYALSPNVVNRKQ